jgi:diacylglycerol kinase (ATP)
MFQNVLKEVIFSVLLKITLILKQFMEKKLNDKYLFVINPISGGQAKDNIVQMIEEFCKINKIPYQIYFTSDNNDSGNIKLLIEKYSPKIIVAGGGDGTVNLVAQHMLNSDKLLGILPTGSGNGLAKDLKIPHANLKLALDTLINFKIKCIDTLTANGRYFMHICDLGFNAHVVRLFNKTKQRGILSYIRFSIREFLKYKTFRYQITTDKGYYKGLAFMITIANSNQFGSNLTINPDGMVDDGEFEIIIIKRFPRKKIVGILFRLLTDKINFSPYSLVLKAKEAVIHTKKEKTLQYDGEIFGKVRKVEIKIFPGSLKVIIPVESQG